MTTFTAAGLVAEAKDSVENLTAEEFAAQMQADGVVVVDLREANERVDTGWIPGSVHVPRGMLEFLTSARAAVGDIAGALVASESLAQIAASVKTAPLQAMSAASQGVVAAGRGDDTEARRCFETAVDIFDRCGLPYEASVWRMSLAQTLRRLSRDEAADKEAGEAARRLEELGAVVAADRASHAAVERGAQPLSGLTPRESEVLAVLAEGLTDREIAERLFISVHTVHRHVSNILTKLDLPSRSAAAAHAARHGLAG